MYYFFYTKTYNNTLRVSPSLENGFAGTWLIYRKQAVAFLTFPWLKGHPDRDKRNK